MRPPEAAQVHTVTPPHASAAKNLFTTRSLKLSNVMTTNRPPPERRAIPPSSARSSSPIGESNVRAEKRPPTGGFHSLSGMTPDVSTHATAGRTGR